MFFAIRTVNQLFQAVNKKFSLSFILNTIKEPINELESEIVLI